MSLYRDAALLRLCFNLSKSFLVTVEIVENFIGDSHRQVNL
ncbi:MAG: hypothetical protein V1770_05825 [bacterium]